jgi:hypothetical protein
MPVLFSHGAGPTASSQSDKPCHEVLQALHVRLCFWVNAQRRPIGMARMEAPQTDRLGPSAAQHKAFQRNERGSSVVEAGLVHAQSG